MAKARGIIKIRGTLGDLTFYKLKKDHIVKQKGGVSKKRIKREPAFARTRENNQEFASCAVSGRRLRTALGPLLFRAKDSRLTSRLLQTLCKIKALDQVAMRGKRTVANGIAGVAGKMLLTGFDFNMEAPMGRILKVPYVLEEAEGRVVFADFIPSRHLAYPKAATHVSLQLAQLRLDFALGTHKLVLSPAQNLAIHQSMSTLEMTTVMPPNLTGETLFLLSLTFYQEVNGIHYSLKRGGSTSLQILGVY
jgi:hypothetical protein